MDISIIHLTDLHLREGDEKWCIEKIENIVNVAITHLSSKSDLFVCVSGDIVFSGRKEEFEIASKFLLSIKEALETKFNSVKVITAPGNHDSCFEKTAVRDSLIQGVYTGSNDSVDSEIIEECAKVQDNYFEFRKNFEEEVDNRAYWSKKFNNDHGKVVFKIFNTSIFSTIEDHSKGYGNLIIPNLERSPDEDGDVVISMFHHPINWLKQINMHKFRVELEKSSDLILTGHEHTPNAYRSVNSELGDNIYVAGDIGKDVKGRLGLSVISVDQKKFITEVRKFKEGTRLSSSSSRFVRTINLEKFKYPLETRYFSELKEMPSTVSHHRKDSLSLDDVYVWPSLKVIDSEETNVDYDVLRPSEYRQSLSESGVKWIFADQFMGKTALMRKLFIDFNEKGKFPITLDASELMSRHADKSKLVMLLSQKVEESYSHSSFENSHFNDRCVFIDGITTNSVDNGLLQEVIDHLNEMCSAVILLADLSYRITELLNFEVSSAGQYEIHKFSGANRVQIVEQWLNVGVQRVDESHEAKVKTYIGILRQAIENNLIPQTPFYMLLLLNNAYTLGGSGVDVSSSVALVDKMIQANLSSIPTGPFGQDGIMNFLKNLAYDIFSSQDENYSIEKFNKFCEAYKKKWKVSLRDDVLDIFCTKRVLEQDHDILSFKDAYMYYYFLGAFISSKQGNDIHVSHALNEMVQKCYREDYSNILVFTSFFSPDLSVFTKVKGEANKILSKYEEVNLGDEVKEFFKKENAEKIKLTIDATNEGVKSNIGKYSDSQQQMSEMEREHVHKVGDDQEDNVIAKSFRFIQILGQMVKNRSGSLDGDLKEALIKEVISLSARLISFIFEVVSERFDEHVDELIERVEKNSSENLDKGVLEKRIKRFFFYVFQFFTLNVVEKITFCAGAKELKVIFDDLYEKNTHSNFYLICSLGISLDYSDNLEISRILNASETFKDDLLSHEIFRHMIYKYLMLNRVNYKTKQKLCETCDIDIKRMNAIAMKSQSRSS